MLCSGISTILGISFSTILITRAITVEVMTPLTWFAATISHNRPTCFAWISQLPPLTLLAPRSARWLRWHSIGQFYDWHILAGLDLYSRYIFTGAGSRRLRYCHLPHVHQKNARNIPKKTLAFSWPRLCLRLLLLLAYRPRKHGNCRQALKPTNCSLISLPALSCLLIDECILPERIRPCSLRRQW